MDGNWDHASESHSDLDMMDEEPPPPYELPMTAI